MAKQEPPSQWMGALIVHDRFASLLRPRPYLS